MPGGMAFEEFGPHPSDSIALIWGRLTTEEQTTIAMNLDDDRWQLLR